MEHFLLPYVVRAKEIMAREWMDLQEIADLAEVPSFLDWLYRELAAARAGGVLPAGPQRVVKVLDVSRSERPFRRVEGRAEGGGSGVLGRGVDTTAGNAEVYQRTPWIAETQPFYYGFCDTQDDTTAVAMLHLIGHSGIKGPLATFIDSRLRQLNIDWRLHMQPLVPTGSFIDQLSSDEVLRLEYKKRKKAGDIGDVPFQPNSQKVVNVTVELKVHGGPLPLKQSTRRRRLEELAESHALFGQEFDEIRADVLINGRKRTIRLDHPGNLQPRYELGDYLDSRHLSEEDLSESVAELYEQVKLQALDFMTKDRLRVEAD